MLLRQAKMYNIEFFSRHYLLKSPNHFLQVTVAKKNPLEKSSKIKRRFFPLTEQKTLFKFTSYCEVAYCISLIFWQCTAIHSQMFMGHKKDIEPNFWSSSHTKTTKGNLKWYFPKNMSVSFPHNLNDDLDQQIVEGMWLGS